jgi:hypothetical protein
LFFTTVVSYIGCTLRRLTSQCASAAVLLKLLNYLAPGQLDFGHQEAMSRRRLLHNASGKFTATCNTGSVHRCCYSGRKLQCQEDPKQDDPIGPINDVLRHNSAVARSSVVVDY